MLNGIKFFPTNGNYGIGSFYASNVQIFHINRQSISSVYTFIYNDMWLNVDISPSGLQAVAAEVIVTLFQVTTSSISYIDRYVIDLSSDTFFGVVYINQDTIIITCISQNFYIFSTQ